MLILLLTHFTPVLERTLNEIEPMYSAGRGANRSPINNTR